MANRAATAQRQGARFAQFKLVLLGTFSPRRRSLRNLLSGSQMLILPLGESAVGKVGDLVGGGARPS